MIQVKNLKKVFTDARKKTTVAVNRFNFSCPAACITGLFGLNGAGKTTTLRLLACLLRPSSGTATVNGYDILQQSKDVRSGIGFLTGEAGLYGRLTPREIMHYFGGLYGMKKSAIDRRVRELSEIFGIGHFLDHRVEQLSGGMKQKVSLVRSLIHDPTVLLLDEPTNGLDVLSRKNVTDFINLNKKRGKCILLSTHLLSEAESICDEIVIIHRGHVILEQNLHNLMARHQENNLENMFLETIRGNHDFRKN
jgi:sodium transport system ATP-binding protein